MLESYYVNKLCSPTRTALLSGRYAYTLGQDDGVIVDGTPNDLQLNLLTVADRLHQVSKCSTNTVNRFYVAGVRPRGLAGKPLTTATMSTGWMEHVGVRQMGRGYDGLGFYAHLSRVPVSCPYQAVVVLPLRVVLTLSMLPGTSTASTARPLTTLPTRSAPLTTITSTSRRTSTHAGSTPRTT
jgi:hypothetical protein